VEQELLTLPEHLSFIQFLVGFICLLYLFVLLPLALFVLVVVLSVIQFTAFDYPFDIFKLFLLVIVFPVM
jgi:hypothetical protein